MIPITIKFKYKLNSSVELREFSITGVIITTNNSSITFIVWNEQTKESLFFKANVWRPLKVFSIKILLKIFKDIHCHFYHSFDSYTDLNNIVEVRRRRKERILQIIKL